MVRARAEKGINIAPGLCGGRGARMLAASRPRRTTFVLARARVRRASQSRTGQIDDLLVEPCRRGRGVLRTKCHEEISPLPELSENARRSLVAFPGVAYSSLYHPHHPTGHDMALLKRASGCVLVWRTIAVLFSLFCSYRFGSGLLGGGRVQRSSWMPPSQYISSQGQLPTPAW